MVKERVTTFQRSQILCNMQIVVQETLFPSFDVSQFSQMLNMTLYVEIYHELLG